MMIVMLTTMPSLSFQDTYRSEDHDDTQETKGDNHEQKQEKKRGEIWFEALACFAVYLLAHTLQSLF
jgi:hypothetical protein